jgi:hypothetical protein
MKQILALLIIVAATGCSTTIKSSLGPDNYDPVSDDVIIKLGYSDKTQTYKFSFMKKKMSRSKYIKRINKLNEEALGYFKSEKMSNEDYTVYAEGSKVFAQVLWYVTAITGGNATAQNKAKASLAGKSANPATGRVGTMVAPVLKTVDPNKIEEGIFEQLADLIIHALDEFLKPFRTK